MSSSSIKPESGCDSDFRLPLRFAVHIGLLDVGLDVMDQTCDHELKKTAREILGVYEQLGRGMGSTSLSSSTSGLSTSVGNSPSSSNAPKNRLASKSSVQRNEAKGHVERAMEVLEGTGLIPIMRDRDWVCFVISRCNDSSIPLLPISTPSHADHSSPSQKVQSSHGLHGSPHVSISPEVYGHLSKGDVEAAL
ncbi:hypothetical protein BT96DRAFT_1007296 [Gymnopus androsaceus JB14]|uniref:Uncharacterized protein n=1 Tax=Gymnopus androsaceus JB14 TaxID=1447944 RepID=A0A6A4GIU2_9AGAR|nr:hypothetical protein BT96DRAFT_1007296 [Gymnopus androsaceus JB14]